MTRKRFHAVRLTFWILQLPLAVLWAPLRTSVPYLVALSVAALIESAFTDFDQARQAEKLKAAPQGDDMSQTERLVTFDGGPMDGVTLTGLFARALVDNDPPFGCFEVDGRFEHYVKIEDCECGNDSCYAFAGSCSELAPHPPCGHDHSKPGIS